MKHLPDDASHSKLFFLHLLSIVTLYASAASFISLMFQLVNLYVPDPLNLYYDASYAKQGLRTAISFLIIMFPVYIGTLVVLNGVYKQNSEARMMTIRKWLIYFTLFVATLIILFSLVALINNVLDGELTKSFLLKLLSVILVAGGILGYYGTDLKKHG